MSPDPSSAARPEPALIVHSLSKAYETTHAVDDLSFRLAPGEILGLVGPNGAGKTTTLRTLAGVLPIEAGRVIVAGHELDLDEREAKRRLAWVPEDPAPFDSLTVWEHLEFTAALYRVPSWEPSAESLLDEFELTEKRAALGGELSRGMRQKLAFCCAWLAEPEVLLLDEPLSGLDPRGIRAAKASIRSRAAHGTAVLLSSHLLGLIEELCHRVLILDRGRRVFDGTLDEARAAVSDGSTSLEDVFFSITGEGADRAREDALRDELGGAETRP